MKTNIQKREFFYYVLLTIYMSVVFALYFMGHFDFINLVLFVLLPFGFLLLAVILLWLLLSVYEWIKKRFIVNAQLKDVLEILQKRKKSLSFYGLSFKGMSIGFLFLKDLGAPATTIFVLAGSRTDYEDYIISLRIRGLDKGTTFVYLHDPMQLTLAKAYGKEYYKLEKGYGWENNPCIGSPELNEFEKSIA